MDVEIQTYVTGCDACQRNKPSHQAKIGLLQPLPIPERPWQQVSLDLIVALPRTKSGHDAVVVFVDKLTKMVHYVATTTNVTAPQLSQLFMREVCRLHGVPESILSDRDPRFTAHFWRALWGQLGTKLTMSTAYHPQTEVRPSAPTRHSRSCCAASSIGTRRTGTNIYRLSRWRSTAPSRRPPASRRST